MPSFPVTRRIVAALLAIAGVCGGTACSHHPQPVAGVAGPAAPTNSPACVRSAKPPLSCPSPSLSPPASPVPTLSLTPIALKVTVAADEAWWQWAYVDQAGHAAYSAGALSQSTTTESMVKAWLVADFLHRREHPGPDRLATLRRAIVDSDDQAAQDTYTTIGGDNSIARLATICALPSVTVHHGWWSLTGINAMDAALMGRCLAGGTAAGPTWTPWLLDQMRAVTGEGRFGIVDGLPADVAKGVAIKNGWTLHSDDHLWHVNCLAVGAGWSLAVTTRYPAARGLSYGAGICRQVAQQISTQVSLA